MIKQATAFGLLFLSTALMADAATWKADAVHSSVGFDVKHLVISKVHGNFRDFDATVEFDGKDLEKGSVNMTVQVTSVDTDNKDRDDHLRSGDFFDVAEYPAMTFKSTKVHDIVGNKFKLTGDLTIRGVTKQVTFDSEFNGVVNDPWGNTKAGFSATTTINRQDFKVSWNKSLDAGGVVVSDDVTIDIELELGQQK